MPFRVVPFSPKPATASDGPPVHFADLPDHGVRRRLRHELLDTAFMAVCATVGGADDWVAVEVFCNARPDRFRKYLELPNGIPSHGTFGAVFRHLDTAAFEGRFRAWMAEVCPTAGLGHAAADGETMRSSGSAGRRALHAVGAFAAADGVTLGQRAVDAESNGIAAVPELPETPDIAGAIATADAVGCRREIARSIRRRKARYLPAVKENRPTRHAEIAAHFRGHLETDFAGVATAFCESAEKNRGRVEYRSCRAFTDVGFLSGKGDWKDLKSAVVVVVTDRREKGRSTGEIRYYICSRKAAAAVLGRAVRAHWGIENDLHWHLDVAFGDDGRRVREGNGAENFARIKRPAPSIVANASGKESPAKKRLAACASDERRELVIAEFPAIPEN